MKNDQRKQGVEFPGGVYQHIKEMIAARDIDPDEVAAYVILQKKKPSKAAKTMDEEINDVLRNAPGKVTQTFDALKALNEGMDLEALTPEQKKIIIEKLKEQGIDAKEIVAPQEVEKPAIDIPQEVLGGRGQGATDMFSGRRTGFETDFDDVVDFFTVQVPFFFGETLPEFVTGKTKQEREAEKKQKEEEKKKKKKENK